MTDDRTREHAGAPPRHVLASAGWRRQGARCVSDEEVRLGPARRRSCHDGTVSNGENPGGLPGALHDLGAREDWIDFDLLVGVFGGITEVRPAWLRLANAEGRPIVETGRPPADPSAIATAEVRAGSEMLGLVSVAGAEAGPLAGLIAEVLARAAYREVEIESLTRDLLDKYEEVTLLLDLSRVFTADLDETALCAAALGMARDALGPEAAWVALAPDGGASLAVLATFGPEAPVDALGPLGGGIMDVVAVDRKPLILHPGEPRAAAVSRWSGTSGVLGVALATEADGGVDGAIVATGDETRRFTAGESRLVGTIASQLGIAVRNHRMLAAARQAERVQQELDIAANIQLGLLPREPPAFPAGELAGRCVPAASIGGDYYDLLVDHEGRLALLIADVAGHSISSALMMTLARGVLRREILAGHAPHEVLAATNATLHDDLAGAGLFITIFCARLDPATGILEYANGGQTLPLLRRADGTVLELDAEGMPAGFLPDAEYDAESVPFGPGDSLLLVTDGVVEARGSDGELFGEARLRELVAGHAGGAAALADDVFAAVGRWMGTQPQTDDVTLVALAGRQPPRTG